MRVFCTRPRPAVQAFSLLGPPAVVLTVLGIFAWVTLQASSARGAQVGAVAVQEPPCGLGLLWGDIARSPDQPVSKGVFSRESFA